MELSPHLSRPAGRCSLAATLPGAKLAAVCLLAALACLFSRVSDAQYATRSVPSDDHFSAFNSFLGGDFNSAQRLFRSAKPMRSTKGVWIDSIAHHTMIGECLYQMGDLSRALEQYTTALQVYLQYPDWMLRVQVPDTLKVSARPARKAPTWGVSSRSPRYAMVPDRVGSRMGNTDEQNLLALQQGGVVSSRFVLMINAKEIARCTALAIRRRAEILGPAGEFDSLNNQLISTLSRRPAPPNNWSQAWVSAQLGLAYAAKGKTTEAVAELNRSLLADGMDHNLTSTSLLELGKLAFQAQDYPAAAGLLFEATYSGAMMSNDDYTQYDIIAEAFRWAMTTHLVSGRQDFLQPLAAAAEWSRRGPRILEGPILVSAAENYAAINDPQRAAKLLDRAKQVLSRRECRKGELGARFQFVSAQVGTQQGDAKRSTSALGDALGFKSKTSKRLFQIAFADQLYTSGSITTRQAGLLFTNVLRDPTVLDWGSDPLESLAVLTTPHYSPYEHWMYLALERKEQDAALRISEALRRHRFYCSLPLGGRLVNLRWTLQAPTDALSDQVRLQRQGLLNRYPAYEQMVRQSDQLRAELSELPAVAENQDQHRKLSQLQAKLTGVGVSLEQSLQSLALSREPSESVFPPATDVAQVQQALDPRQRVMVFISTSKATFGFLLGAEEYSTWQLESPKRIQANAAKMLREMGLYDRNQPLTVDQIRSDAWKDAAVAILKDLTADAPADAWDQFDELVIVPDGLLWYVPFEALQIEDGDERIALIDKVRIRYAPTISLAVPDARPRKRDSRTAVVTGSLFPRDDETAAEQLLADLKADDANIFGIPAKTPPSSNVLPKTVDRLVVLNDLSNDVGGPYGWNPLAADRRKSSASLGQWMSSPWGGPDQLVLPGFHTPAENGLKQAGNGSELFLTACGLMAMGSRTVLLSRWRDGGQTSYDLIREFVRELPHRSASAAWQRSVRLAVNADLIVDQEPRVKSSAADIPELKAAHPFFWSGYMLLDTGVEQE